ncbi:hypothetical protein [Leptolyngbya sp. GGD]|uniref:hypothetical protein n=1 Tax=Leptolyngbya sp. GGD TaxID=2997907 RepID=UPI00227A032E|nr:hypothetical protein [Leptolyngbya sp. GGD]MCY6494114.1 hypothetical protein [Leptolyngbya sp. GGD]
MSPSRTFKSSGADRLNSRVNRFVRVSEAGEVVELGTGEGLGVRVGFWAWAVQLARRKAVRIIDQFIEDEGNHF